MPQSKHSILDDKTIKLMKSLNVKPKICKYCKGEYYPYTTELKKEWEKRKYCSSICKANAELKPFEKTLTK